MAALSSSPTFAERLRQQSELSNLSPPRKGGNVQTMLGAENSTPSQEERSGGGKAGAEISADESWANFMKKLPFGSNHRASPAQPSSTADAIPLFSAPGLQFDDSLIPPESFDAQLDNSNAGLALMIKNTRFDPSIVNPRKRDRYQDSPRNDSSGADDSDEDMKMSYDRNTSSVFPPPNKKTKVSRATSPRKPLVHDSQLPDDDVAPEIRETQTPQFSRTSSAPVVGRTIWTRSNSRRLIRNLSPSRPNELTTESLAEHNKSCRSTNDGETDSDSVSVADTLTSVTESVTSKGPSPKVLSESDRLLQRQRQIDLGKDTEGYKNYRRVIPKSNRIRRVHPRTPNKNKECSKRSWDGQIRTWRRLLHLYDPIVGSNDKKIRLLLDPLADFESEQVVKLARDPEQINELHKAVHLRQENGEKPAPSPLRTRSSPNLSRRITKNTKNRNGGGPCPKSRDAASPQSLPAVESEPVSESPVDLGVEPIPIDSLQEMDVEQQREFVGERVFTRIEIQHPELAPNLTGMLLEMDLMDLCSIYNDPQLFQKQIDLAVDVYQAAQ